MHACSADSSNKDIIPRDTGLSYMHSDNHALFVFWVFLVESFLNIHIFIYANCSTSVKLYKFVFKVSAIVKISDISNQFFYAKILNAHENRLTPTYLTTQPLFLDFWHFLHTDMEQIRGVQMFHQKLLEKLLVCYLPSHWFSWWAVAFVFYVFVFSYSTNIISDESLASLCLWAFASCILRPAAPRGRPDPLSP